MKERVTLKQVLYEPDPEVQKWLKDISDNDYDFVSRVCKEIRYTSGTRAKMILHRALKEYLSKNLKT